MRKKINKLILGLFLFCISVSMSVVSANAAETDGCENVTQEYMAEEAKDYIAGKNTYPTKDGYLFAGWYTTDVIPADDTVALKYAIQSSVPAGVEKVYALFVPVHVLDVKAQISSNLMSNMTTETSGSIRFVTTINTLLYKQVGFDISYVNSSGTEKNATSSSNKVYKKLYAVGTNEEDKTYVPTDFCAVSTYFKACTINNIPNANFATPFEIRPFWVTLDGSKVYGETVIKSIDDYLLAQDVYVSTAGDDANAGTEAVPVQTLNCALGKVKNQGTVHIVDSYATTTDFVWEKHNKTVNITGGTIDFTTLPQKELRKAQGTDTEDTSDDVAVVTANVLDVYDSVTFKNTKLTFANGQHVYANGNTVEIASDVTWGNTSAYIQIYGGAHSAALKSDTNLILGAGQYTRVFGGGNYDSPLTGNVNVTLSGSINPNVDPSTHNRDYAVFGGGVNKSKVEGDINLKILDETVRFRHVYGGGEWNAVEGDIYVTFAGSAFSVYGGGYDTTVTGDIYLTMSDGWTEQIFGGCNGKSMTGNTNVNVLGGTVERRIYGGCYNGTSGTSFATTACVNGHSNVSISSNAKIELDFSDGDNSIYAISRGGADFTDAEGNLIEKGAFIFNQDLYEKTYKSKLGYNDGIDIIGFSETTHHYLIMTNGNTADGSLGTVSSEGDYLRIQPRRGYSAVVAVEGQQKHYSESETVFKLPELTATDDTKNITVTFEIINSGVDKTGYQARIDGAYYDTIEEAVAVAPVLDSKETVTVTVLQDVEVAAQMDIVSKVTIQNEPGKDITIYRGSGVATTDMFNVTSTGTLTLAGVEDRTSLVFDGQNAAGRVIQAEGHLTLENITVQNVKGTTGNGGAISCKANLTVQNCMFNTCSASGEGGAIYAINNYKVHISDSTFVENESTGERGGAICIGTKRSNPIVISDCTFETNTAKENGGAIRVSAENTLNITDSLFDGNTATNAFGGAVAMGTNSSTVNLSGNVIFNGNTSCGTGYGGGAIMTGSVLSIAENADVTIKNNETKGLGGGIYFNAGTAPEFMIGEGAILTMSSNTDKNGDVNIAVKADVLQEGDRFVYGNNVTDEHSNVNVGDVTYNLDANGYLVGLNPIVELRQENLTRQFASLDIALSKVTNGDTIALLRDLTLDKQLVIDKSMTITTDGDANRTIYCGVDAVSDNVIEIAGTDIQVRFMGTENSQLIFDGKDVVLAKAFIAMDSGEKVTMKYVTMQNITSERSDGNGAAVYSEVSLEITNCEFKDSISNKHGGAIYCNADLTVLESVFDMCKAYDEDTTKNYNGGAICATGDYKLSITDSKFMGNTADYRGGAIYVETQRSDAISISGCTFGSLSGGGNTATNAGGAIHVAGKNTINISESTFVGNKSETYFGGAVSIGTGTSTLNLSGTCVFSDNTAAGTSSYKGGGAIFAPANFNIKTDAWVEMSGNECTGYASGDALCVNADKVANAKFVIENGAALYVYNNPTKADADNDICIKDGTVLSPTVNEGGNYGDWEPIAKLGNVGYQTLQSAVDAVGDGEEISLIHDTILNEKLSVSKSVTITTDGEANRTIYCGADAVSDNVIEIAGTDIQVRFMGTENSQLIFDGKDVVLAKAFIAMDSGEKVTMKYVTMQNITSERSEGNGAAVFSEVSLEITSCEFQNCVSNKHGGAIYCNANLTVLESVFDTCKVYDENTTKNYNGGAICATGDYKLSLTDSKFMGNTADYRGGAIYIETQRSEAISISGCTFGNIASGGNTATNAGGAIHVAGKNTINISESTFVGNKSETYFGGAVSIGTGTSTLNLSGTCVFSDNTAAGTSSYKGGGAIFAPANFNIKTDAWVEISGNECTDYASGDAICVNVDKVTNAKFVIGNGAALYVYNNPTKTDADNDICIKDGTALSPSENEGCTYSTTAPDTTE